MREEFQTALARPAQQVGSPDPQTFVLGRYAGQEVEARVAVYPQGGMLKPFQGVGVPVWFVSCSLEDVDPNEWIELATDLRFRLGEVGEGDILMLTSEVRRDVTATRRLTPAEVDELETALDLIRQGIGL